MCRPVNHPSHSHINTDEVIDPFTITSFDIEGLDPVTIRGKTMSVGKMKKTKHRTNKLKLENIPEETELYVDNSNEDTHHPGELEEACIHLEMDLEVLRKSIDVGVCVLCLGLGYMVSTKLRPRQIFSSLLSSSFFFL
ncbi:uncharacterized protein LOC131655936 [Vicia villosa]|uniref:uncharacterized protein LOC131655936 n=1 Tax=Vicia villosa TaxID=3911 RepID=UPI00273C3541|nr:uncharacterized protein LOC131655936 [Vicia villosa]